MPRVLPNTTTANAYPAPGAGGAQLGIGDIFASGYFVVANAAVQAEFFHGLQGQQVESPELFLAPGTYPLLGTPTDPLGGLRFRSAVAGSPAQVFGVLYYPGEASLQAAAEFSSTVSTSGAITPAPVNAAYILVSLTAAFAVPDAALTTVKFDTIASLNDPNGIFAYSPATGILTVGAAGVYLANTVLTNLGVGGTQRRVGIVDTNLGRVGENDGPVPGSATASATGTSLLPAGGSLHVDTYQDTGGPIGVGGHLLVELIST